MNTRQRRRAVALAQKILPAEEFAKFESIAVRDMGFGFDAFGMEKETALLGYAVGYWLYKYYFRVESRGQEHIPPGRVLVTPNHSGVLPIDGGLIWVDLVHRLLPSRLARAVVDNFLGDLPYVSTFFYRAGQIVGARRNFEDLLRANELVIVFPEGAKGTGKFFWRRYRLLEFHVGFVELALRFGAPIVPTAVIGGEEQAPMFFDIKPIARLLGFPYFPVTPFFPHLGVLGGLPLPVKYDITYGPALDFSTQYGPDAVNDPEVVRMLADRVRLTVQGMVDDALARRESVFGFGRTG
ncbi:MAG: acyltransferase family protein [Deltaproteobacteria bacterium]|nr:acyltransferase family protein [Deltaproteobacteria bacterium]